MRVLIVINSSWNIINFRSNLIKKIKNDGNEVFAITNKDDYSHKLENLVTESNFVSFKSSSINPFSELKLFFHLYWKIRKIKPDIILTFTVKPNIYASIIGKILNINTVNNVAGLGIAHSNIFLRNILKLLYKFSLSNSYKCFFQNENDLEYFLKNKIVDDSLTSLLPGSGVDIEYFNMNDEQESSKKLKSEFNFLLSSRLLWSKGIHEYVKAARLIKKEFNNVKFWLIGFSNVDNKDSIDSSRIEKWSTNGDIIFKGSTDNIKFFLKDVHSFILPSYYPEGTPKSLLEAASMKLPIITTNTPGCKNVVIDNVTGYLCQPKNHQDLYDKMKKILLLSHEERKLMGEQARKHIIKNYDDNIVNDAYISTIRFSKNK
tara:strand:- start:276 stop:1400 length:1125 start_codon:yes stop_codon:yes gene_type:complete